MQIECITGPAETQVGDETYAFRRDKHGRFICEVYDLRHVQCLLSVAKHYREAKPVLVADAPTALDTTYAPANDPANAPANDPAKAKVSTSRKKASE